MNKHSINSESEAPNDFRQVEITREPIELFKILKFEGLAGSGGEAKSVIASGKVTLNGAIETQRRKKIVSGDKIEFGDDKICIKFSPHIKNKISPDKTNIEPVEKNKTATRKSAPALAKGHRKK